MKYLVFTVRDRATDQYGSPMFLISVGQAVRSFTDEVNRADATNGLFAHPDDFDLYTLGSWDSDSGLFDAGVPQMVVAGKSVKVRQ
jgi:hypothetical protein